MSVHAIAPGSVRALPPITVEHTSEQIAPARPAPIVQRVPAGETVTADQATATIITVGEKVFLAGLQIAMNGLSNLQLPNIADGVSHALDTLGSAFDSVGNLANAGGLIVSAASVGLILAQIAGLDAASVAQAQQVITMVSSILPSITTIAGISMPTAAVTSMLIILDGAITQATGGDDPQWAYFPQLLANTLYNELFAVRYLANAIKSAETLYDLDLALVNFRNMVSQGGVGNYGGIPGGNVNARITMWHDIGNYWRPPRTFSGFGPVWKAGHAPTDLACMGMDGNVVDCEHAGQWYGGPAGFPAGTSNIDLARGPMPAFTSYMRNPDALATQMIPYLPGATGTAHEGGLKAEFGQVVTILRAGLKFKMKQLVARKQTWIEPPADPDPYDLMCFWRDLSRLPVSPDGNPYDPVTGQDIFTAWTKADGTPCDASTGRRQTPATYSGSSF